MTRLLTISSSELSATFAPDTGMLGTALVFRGRHVLDLSGGVARYERGEQTGLPLLAPWANRLAEWRYEVDGIRVDLEGIDLGTDENGLPIHGTMTAASGWEVLDAQPARLRTRFDYGARSDLLRAFPFPFELFLDMVADGGTLAITARLCPTGDRRVPVAFGWHPYLRMPDAPRRECRLVLPARRHYELDNRNLPTGASNPEAAEADPIGDRTFDDLYELEGRASLGIEHERLHIFVHHDDGYPFAQIYAPPHRDVVCLEPMTALTNSLLTGSCELVDPGDSFTARFSIEVREP